MQYVIMDPRQRLLGTINHAPLAAGDTFTTAANLTYAVVNVDFSHHKRSGVKTLTVVQILQSRQARTPQPVDE
ncbi:MAG: hypothetical protein H7Y22_12815 [Gemmatimonadaceae bacterium]|nr:hypothetical protein [Gloeobacterales cyanobacterium ES-bin-141]